MIVGILQIELRLHESHSLKEKRMVLKGLKDRLHERFNVSVSEIDHQDAWQRALIGIATIGTDKVYVNGLLSKVLDWVTAHRAVELVSSQMEML
ncbi:MAG: DUF503 domain-containing protein [Candidatus Omnitrophica bacterium]|nr:DUF503 domain-containing protein [Candidatus Omnitrophota bacterium]